MLIPIFLFIKYKMQDHLLPIPEFLPTLQKKQDTASVLETLKYIKKRKLELQKSETVPTQQQNNYFQKIIYLSRQNNRKGIKSCLSLEQTDENRHERSDYFEEKINRRKQTVQSHNKERKIGRLNINLSRWYDNKLIKKLQLLPSNPEIRTKIQIKSLYRQLSQNMFFKKINQYLALCLLRINSIVRLDGGDYLYRRGDKNTSIYIILQGLINLHNPENNFKKICYSGETCNQECLFVKNSKTKENAKSISTTYLLQFNKKDYKILQSEIHRNKQSNLFKEMESIFFGNFHSKQGHRINFTEKIFIKNL